MKSIISSKINTLQAYINIKTTLKENNPYFCICDKPNLRKRLQIVMYSTNFVQLSSILKALHMR